VLMIYYHLTTIPHLVLPNVTYDIMPIWNI